MELFTPQSGLPKLDRALAFDTREARREALTLAWGLRQISPERSLEIVMEIERQLAAADASDADSLELARCALIRAEHLWLTGALGQANSVLATAREGFRETLNFVGLSDCHLLASQIDDERGLSESRDSNLHEVVRLARAGQDECRAMAAELTLARFQIYQSPRDEWNRLSARAQQMVDDGAIVLAPVLSGFQSRLFYSRGDTAAAVAACIDSFEKSLATCQIRRAINAGINAGVYFASLSDIEGATDSLDQAISLARERGWPHSIAGCLYAMATNLAGVSRAAEAELLFREAKGLIGSYPASRYSINIELFLANFQLDNGDAQNAGNSFTDIVELAHQLGENDLENKALRGMARSYARLGLGTDAKRVAGNALEHAIQTKLTASQALTLQLLGDIFSEFTVADVATDKSTDPAVGYWLQALELIERHSLHNVEIEVLDSLASRSALLGDMTAAYNYAKKLVAAANRANEREATNRAMAFAVRQRTQEDRADAQRNRELVDSENLRTQEIEKGQVVLERLSSIGQELATNLDATAVVQIIERHAQALFDASQLSVHLLRGDGITLRDVNALESDPIGAPVEVRIDDLASYVARCARDKEPIVADWSAEENLPTALPGRPGPVRSAMFAPLLGHDRVFGVLTIRSHQPHAYGSRERQIFQTLAAYCALGLHKSQGL